MRRPTFTILDRLCSCCLDEGILTNLWLVKVALYLTTFCPRCDGMV